LADNKMNLPQPGDYIDIHTHRGKPSTGVFIIENIMAHEENIPENNALTPFSFGIHPWFLDEANYQKMINSVLDTVHHPALIAVGEAGFDKLRGPSTDLQRKVFEMQIVISEENKKPLIIHCVKAWDELLFSHKKLKPKMPWLIHGFRGSVELADQLISRGFYLSFWFDFILRPESAELIGSVPKERIFLETDGTDVDIRNIYKKVAADLNVTVEDLKSTVLSNYLSFFDIEKEL
jgi:TatD DNase family protein